MDLTKLIDQFLDERLEGRKLSLEQATRYRFVLVGDPSRPLSNVGFVRFLKALGLTAPTLDELNSRRVGRYWEFLTQYFGVLQSHEAMRALRSFWEWCVANGHIKGRPTPSDLNAVSPADLYRIDISIEERKGGRS